MISTSILIAKEVENYNELLQISSIYKNSIIEDEINKCKIQIGICAFVLGFIFLFSFLFITKLMINHILLACQNVTFYENLKKKFNLLNRNIFYRHNCFYNLISLIFHKPPKGSLNLNKIYYDRGDEVEMMRTY